MCFVEHILKEMREERKKPGYKPPKPWTSQYLNKPRKRNDNKPKIST